MPVLILHEFERVPVETQCLHCFAAARQYHRIEEDGGRVLERGVNFPRLPIFATYGSQASAQ